MKSAIADNIKLIKVLADESRYQIFDILIESNGELCVNEIADRLDITASAVSHQLNKLEMQGLVSSRRNGQMVRYHLEENPDVDRLRQIFTLLGTR